MNTQVKASLQLVKAGLAGIGRSVLGLDAPKATVSVNDFSAVMWAGRRMTPDEVRFILQGAIGGNFKLQWELFDMMEDTWPRLQKNLSEVRRAAARTTFAVQPYCRKGEEPTDSARERAETVDAGLQNWRPVPGTLELSFESALFNALDCHGKGLSVLELTWQRCMDGILPRCAHFLPASHYGWNAAGTELGLTIGTGAAATWQPFAPSQFLVGVWEGRSGAPGQTALLRCLAPYWCGITFGWEWLLNNAQIFGVPLRWATYDSSQPHILPQLQTMLANLGAAGWAAFPSGTDLQFKEAVQRASDNPQVFVQTLADKYCDLVILGQEASGESKAAGLGNGAADLHASVRADRLQDAVQWCADLLNYQLVPAILRINYGDESEPPKIVPADAAESDPKMKAERDVQLSQIAALPLRWFYERHGIPVPEEGEETVGGPAGQTPSFPPVGGNSSGTAPGSHGDAAAPESDAAKKADSKPENAQRGMNGPAGQDKRSQSDPPRSAVALAAAAASGSPAQLPGAYRLPAQTRAELLSAQALDLEPLRKAAVPLLKAIESGNLEVVGELEAFIARLDSLAPSIVGATELADALEGALAEASISGAAGAYSKVEKHHGP